MLMVFTLGWLPVNILNILEDLEVSLHPAPLSLSVVGSGAASVLALLLLPLLLLPRDGDVVHLLQPSPLRLAQLPSASCKGRGERQESSCFGSTLAN